MSYQNTNLEKKRLETIPINTKESGAGCMISQFFIFKQDIHIGWDCFYKEKISIGSSEKADLVLKGNDISAIHAIVYLKNNQIVVKSQNREGKVLINNQPAEMAILGRFDYLDIGPYTIKIKLMLSTNSTSNNQIPLKKRKNTVLSKKTEEVTIDATSNIEVVHPPVKESETNTHRQDDKQPTIQIPESKPDNHLLPSPDKDEDEDEDEDREALFALKDLILNDDQGMKASAKNKEVNVEVTKFKNNTMVDIFFLKPKNQYYIRSKDRKFLLAENTDNGDSFFYFSDHVYGAFLKNGSDTVKTDYLKKTANLQNENEGIYQYPIQIGDTVTITDGIFEYIIRPISVEESPAVTLPEQEERAFHKYMIKSSIFHLFLLVFLGFFNSVKQPEPLPPETHFVKIDTSELSKIITKKQSVEKPVVKPKIIEPKKKKKQIVMESRKKIPEVVENKKMVSKVMDIRKKISTTGTGNNKEGSNQVVSRSPQAGGGFGQGNIVNRNINQQGLLSMLGNSVGIQPQAAIAMAAVTNLDAVSSVHSGNAKFKVGGIVGNLGNARIEIPKISNTGIVTTKGSSQVLRSYGAEGKGMVAALEKGKIGQKQVQGMVSAQLSAQLRMQAGVKGGMSREAVKRVIDQHLDEISYCYETALISNPSILGKVVFEWKILASGMVGEVQIKSSSINSNEIHSCIKAAIKTWQFPKPEGSEVIVSYPFVFDIVGF